MKTSDRFEMPQPPKLDALFRAHQQEVSAAQQKADELLQSVRQKDEQIATLVDTYQKEIEQVHLIAKAVVDAPTAIASVPLVLAAANAAFAQAPVCDADLQKMFSDCISAMEANTTTAT